MTPTTLTTSTPTLRALDPRDLIRSVLIWALLIPLALISFLAAEITHLDLVDAVNALVYGFGALLAIALARQASGAAADGTGVGDPFGRLFWLAAAAFCAVFVLSELGGDFIEHFEARMQPIWLGHALCWIAAGAFVLCVALLRPRHARPAKVTAPVISLLAVGFGLQSMALGLDIGEPHLRHHFGVDPLTYDNLNDLLEFAFLQLYLLAFIGLAAEVSAQHALRAQVARAESIEDSAECLRAAQLAFTTAAFTSHKINRRRLSRAVMGLVTGSGIGGIMGAIKLTRHLGPSIRRRSGKSLFRQFVEQMRFMFRHHLAPKAYYQFELFDPACGNLASQYLQRNETKSAAYKIMHRATGHRLSEKLDFHNRCHELGLPIAPVVFAAAEGAVEEQFRDITALPETDLFIKPRKGSGGRGAAKWQFLAPFFTHKDGTQLTATGLRQWVVDQSAQENMLVQTLLTNHPDLADINCGTLATVRIVTCRNESGGYEVTDAAFRMPRVSGSAVDNFHAGGIASSVDIATGRLGAATDLGLSPKSGWFDAHPVTGAVIRGRALPCWQEARDLVERAHPHFSDFAVIGWDVGILADGPCIIEANGAPDLDIIQRTARHPLGNARLGRLMAWHVRRDLRHALLG
nr:sugar-transfer associated ATP-grasp domain-containing protein [uncultured Dongia sp.]